MDPLILYYRRHAGRGREDILPIYVTPLFMQREHGLGSKLSGLLRNLSPILWSGDKSMGKQTLRALVREALRTGGRILTDIAENSQAATREIVSKHVTDTTQNIIKKSRGGSERDCRPL